ncbi:MAG: rRNA maturation RNase YbeY [Chloroflexota bacterium]
MPEYCHIGVRITGEKEMRDLNRTFRHVDTPTDVLSFSFFEEAEPSFSPTPDIPVYAGDIAISFPRVQRQAEELEHGVDKELAWLTIHGMLQVLGYTHETEEEGEHMEALERSALLSMGFD